MANAIKSSSSSPTACSFWRSQDMPIVRAQPAIERSLNSNPIRSHNNEVMVVRRGMSRVRKSGGRRPMLFHGGFRLTGPATSPISLSVSCVSQKESTGQKPEEEEEERRLQPVEEELRFERLFSNLNQATLKREPGSLTSAIFLVSGTTDLLIDIRTQKARVIPHCNIFKSEAFFHELGVIVVSIGMAPQVGAGILAIPAVTQESGFVASAVTCILCWVVTGLLVAEVNVKTMCELGSGGVSLVSMARRTLGTAGVQIACWSYIFIHYALLVAYVARSSDILTDFLGVDGSIMIADGNLQPCSHYFWEAFATLEVASGDLHWDALLKANFQAVPLSIPIIALSFVYQNVVPVLCTDLEGDLGKVRYRLQSEPDLAQLWSAIVLGTAIPLALFLVWDAVILGSITNFERGSDKIADPLQQLQSINEVVGPIVQVFSLLAIATSYIGFVLGLTDFLADLLKLPSGQSRPLPYLLTLIPPLVLSLLDPDIFFKALDFAGTYGVLVLFGILPGAMSWSDRYSDSSDSPKLPQLVPGGKLTLSIVIGGAGFVIFSELLENFGLAN
ncbi:hypothetical protein RHGRI_037890 [Rhododendron griersonianum]|uniref:Tyrosine-specific transport protein n=1 Tax=Rhododendron griersonianum TaxID=479676 RepID=A0AAV6HZ02_9ERIC|nr:hypothetical protein RHGRI_037890 [Rhododendron griersonianum]